MIKLLVNEMLRAKLMKNAPVGRNGNIRKKSQCGVARLFYVCMYVHIPIVGCLQKIIKIFAIVQ